MAQGKAQEVRGARWSILVCAATFLLAACDEQPAPFFKGDRGAQDSAGMSDSHSKDSVAQPADAAISVDVKGIAEKGPPHDAGQPWVKILSPLDKSTVKNPVTFTISANKVAQVQILVDNWALSQPWDPSKSNTLTYKFTGVNFVRKVLLQGFDAAAAKVAKHEITITVTNP